jgi:cytosine/adenosine deaminase-related metal-dependent hydrolase
MTSLDILVKNGVILTMNSKNEIIKHGSIGIKDDRIVSIGPTSELDEYGSKRIIDASNSIVMPGFIDTYAHAGHSMIKGIWHPFRGWPSNDVYFHASTEDFWYADGLLAALDRVKSGTTTGVSIIGATPARLDDPAWAENNAKGVMEVGIKGIIGVGPPDPFIPGQNRLESTIWQNDTPKKNYYSYDDTLSNSEKVIKKWHMKAKGRIKVALAFPYLCGRLPSHSKPGATYHYKEEDLSVLLEKAQEIRELSNKYGIQIHSHLYGKALEFGLEKFGKENLYDLIGPDVVLAHCNGLTPKEVSIIAETDTKIATAPSATEPTRFGRCPVPELIEAGAKVATSTDGAAPHMSFDMFISIRNEILIQRYHKQDPSYLPAGKALRMATIDAAHVLGCEDEIGSLEVGKKADIVLIDAHKAHFTPMVMVPQLLVYYGSGHDVNTVIVDGEIIMEDREVKTVDEHKIIDFAKSEIENSFSRFRRLGFDLDKYLEIGKEFWTRQKISND